MFEKAPLLVPAKSNCRDMACVVQRSWKHSTLGPTAACKALRRDRIQSFEVLLLPYSSLSKIPLSKPVVAATSRHSKKKTLLTMAAVLHRRCTWRRLTSNNPMYPFPSRFLLDVNVISVRAAARGGVPAWTSSWSPHITRCVTILAFDSLLSLSCSHLDLTFPTGFWLHPARTPLNLQQSWCLDILRCTTCITLSSISSICSTARRTVQPQPQGRQLSVPECSGTRRQLAQHCLLLVLHGLDIINFTHCHCSLDTPTLSCASVFTVSVAGFVAPCLPQPMTNSQVSTRHPWQLV